jgi:hypothetical protein
MVFQVGDVDQGIEGQARRYLDQVPGIVRKVEVPLNRAMRTEQPQIKIPEVVNRNDSMM